MFCHRNDWHTEVILKITCGRLVIPNMPVLIIWTFKMAFRQNMILKHWKEISHSAHLSGKSTSKEIYKCFNLFFSNIVKKMTKWQVQIFCLVLWEVLIRCRLDWHFSEERTKETGNSNHLNPWLSLSQWLREL